MPKRLVIARLSHEGNSFSPVLTGPEAFARRAAFAKVSRG
jgi:microcystin degradation protein MlrC